MSHSDFECIRSVTIIAKDGLPTSSSICTVPSLIENSLSVASAGLDGLVRLVQFEDGLHPSHATQVHSNTTHTSSMELDSTPLDTDVAHDKSSASHADVLVIGRDNYPVLAVASVSRDSYTCVAFGGLSRQVQLVFRSASSFPDFYPLIALDISLPVSAIQLQTISYNKREEITWNLRVFAGSQDKSVHMFSVSIVISLDGKTVKCNQFHHLMFVGHTSYVRALSFNHSATGDAVSLLSGADDFVLKVWPLNLLETDKVIRCTTYEGHEDDILAMDCKSGWIVTGSKDKSVGFWDLNPAKTVRAEKTREVKIARVLVGSVVRSVLLSEDATMAFAGCGDGSVKTLVRSADSTWSLSSSHQLHPTSAPVDSLLFTQNVLVTSSSQDPQRSIAVWTLPSSS